MPHIAFKKVDLENDNELLAFLKYTNNFLNETRGM